MRWLDPAHGRTGFQAPGQLQESQLSIHLKGKLAIGISALAVAALAGGAYAASRESHADGRQAFLNDAAKRLHVTPAELSAALQGAAVDQVKAAVAAGRMTRAEGERLTQEIQQGRGPIPGPFGWFGEWRLHGPGAAVGPPRAGPGGPWGKGSGGPVRPGTKGLRRPPGRPPWGP